MLLVRLQKDILAGQKPPGIPDAWPAEVEEVADGTPDPKDGRLVMATAADLEVYKLSQQGTYDAWRAGVDLPALKQAKFDAIDDRTEALIAEGFVYTGKRHSLSQNAQTTYTGLYAVRAEAALIYPVKVNTIDDADFSQLANAAEVQIFYLTAVGTYRAHLDSGTALKDTVRAATTAAAVAAVIDVR